MTRLIVGLVGPIASGKGTIKEYLIKNYKARDCRFSTVLRDILARIKMPSNRENMQRVSTALRNVFGENILAKVITSDAVSMEGDIVVVDGVRRLADVEFLSKEPQFKLIAVDAKPEIRHRRLVLRNENVGDKEKSFEQFMKDHEYETETSIPQVMEKADFKINNDGTFDDLCKQVDGTIKKLLR